MKKGVFVFAVLVILFGVMIYLKKDTPETVIESEPVAEELVWQTSRVLGTSVEGRNIEVHTYGTGDTHLLFVGGIHGGYEWNSVILAYEMMDYIEANQTVVPENVRVSIIPNLNPDGLYKVLEVDGRFTKADVPSEADFASGRFNANGIDLNRNFDCKWKPESSWRGKTVSAGSEVFSEPEAQVLRDFVLKEKPRSVAFWHSQADTVYASKCEEGVLPETEEIMHVYADAAGYNKVLSFDAYPVSGDAEGWLASIGIPAITVELKTHETVEFEQNLKGVKALLEYYRE